jgi:hypothetical protein
VVNGDKHDQRSTRIAGATEPKLVGDGWDTVAVLRLPSGDSANQALNLVHRFGKPVSGAWGSGQLISTDIANALVTSDGRIAVGFVPQQVLVQALGAK